MWNLLVPLDIGCGGIYACETRVSPQNFQLSVGMSIPILPRTLMNSKYRPNGFGTEIQDLRLVKSIGFSSPVRERSGGNVEIVFQFLHCALRVDKVDSADTYFVCSLDVVPEIVNEDGISCFDVQPIKGQLIDAPVGFC